MKTIEFAPKAATIVGRIATVNTIKASENSKWDYDALVVEVRDSANKAHELRFIENFADGFNFKADLFIGNIITADVEYCIGNTTQYLDQNDKPQFHLFDHTRVVAIRASTEDEVVGFLTTAITKTEVATLKAVYDSLGKSVDVASLVLAARNSATPLIVSAKESLMAERKSFTEAYNKLNVANSPKVIATKADVKAERLAELTAKRDALVKTGATPALVASYDRKIAALEAVEA